MSHSNENVLFQLECYRLTKPRLNSYYGSESEDTDKKVALALLFTLMNENENMLPDAPPEYPPQLVHLVHVRAGVVEEHHGAVLHAVQPPLNWQIPRLGDPRRCIKER